MKLKDVANSLILMGLATVGIIYGVVVMVPLTLASKLHNKLINI